MPRLLEPFAAAPGEPVHERLVCASMASSGASPYEQLSRIRDSALRNNTPRHLHATVLYQSQWFIYWLEGPTAALRETVKRIGKDARHHSMQVLHDSRGRRFLPTPWSMGLMPSTETPERFGARVANMRHLLREGFQFAPTSVVRRLCAPFGLVSGHESADAESFHRVGVVAANGVDSFGLVNWLAGVRGHRVATRRLAGEQDMDSASAYAESAGDGLPVRLIAVARTGLAHGLQRAFLCDWSYLMLLFSGDQRLDAALLERAQRARENLPCPAPLLAVCPDADTHLAVLAAADAMGLELRSLGVMAPGDFESTWLMLTDELRRDGLPAVSLWPIADQRMVA